MSTVSRAKAQSLAVIRPNETIEMTPEGSLYNLQVLPKNGTSLRLPARRQYKRSLDVIKNSIHVFTDGWY